VLNLLQQEGGTHDSFSEPDPTPARAKGK